MFQQITKLIAYSFIFILLAIGISFGSIFYIKDSYVKIPKEQNVIICGTQSLQPELSEHQQLGEILFKANCASCHKLYKKMAGPSIAGISDKYEQEWLYKWIKNSSALIESGDAQAVAIYEEYNQASMNAFPQLTHKDIDAIVSYLDAH